jgi:CRP-like cAMP-binding protein
MPIAMNSEEALEIRKLIPLATLPLSRFESICARIDILTAVAGEVLFNRGDDAKELVYLLSGDVSLQAAGMQVDIINAHSYSGRFALAQHNPRKIDAVALNALRYLRLDADWLNLPKTYSTQEDTVYMTANASDDNPDDWMTILLSSPIFANLPPANLQKLLMSLEEVQIAKGAVVLRQGSLGEYYYLIKQGQCILSRKPNPNARDIKLAQLRTGDTFGEDALLSDQTVNVSVTALTDLSLLRLNKERFITLVKTPTLSYIEAAELERELKAGAFIVDVRLQDDYIAWHLQGSINAPFFSLLMQFKTFDRTRTAIVVCDDGKISAAAAFFLLRNKFTAKILNNGLCGLPPDCASGGLVSFVHNAAVRKTFMEDEAVEPEITQTPSEAEEATPDQLMTENRNLKAIVQRLQQQCAIKQQEKAFIEKQYQDLAKQIEQMKGTLQQLKIS